jgi:hypothetical protein
VFSKELMDLLAQILRSWQVIVVAIVMILYIKLVSHTAKRHHRPKMSKKKAKRVKFEIAQDPKKAKSGSNIDNELGLEE